MYRRTVYAQLNIAKHTHLFRGLLHSEGRPFTSPPPPLSLLLFNSLLDTQYFGRKKEAQQRAPFYTYKSRRVR